MKKNRLLILLFLLTLGSGLRAQEKPLGFVAAPDSAVRLLQAAHQNDSLKTALQSVLALPAGRHRLKLIFLHDRSWANWAVDTTVNVPVADTLFLHRIHKALMPLEPFTTVTLKGTRSKKFRLKHLLKPGLAAVTVASNWASFYLKRRADDFYRTYQKTSDLKKIDAYYHKTRVYDAVSNALLGLSTLSVSAFLYLLISD